MADETIKGGETAEQPLFTAETTITRELYGEFAKVTFRRYSKRYTIINTILGVLEIGLSVPLIYWGEYVLVAIVFILLGAYMIFMAYFGYIARRRSAYKQMVSINGENPLEQLTFFSHSFTAVIPNSTATFEYAQITAVLETEHLLCLMIGKQTQVRRGIMVDKSGFTLGSGEELRSYFRGIGIR